jgi:hypothetical protein
MNFKFLWPVQPTPGAGLTGGHAGARRRVACGMAAWLHDRVDRFEHTAHLFVGSILGIGIPIDEGYRLKRSQS